MPLLKILPSLISQGSFTGSLGDTTKQQQIVTQKQTLRDVTTTDLSTITNTQELKNVWPDILSQ